MVHKYHNLPDAIRRSSSVAIFKRPLKTFILSAFYPRDAMLARVLAMALCPSVSVCHKSVFYRNG